MAKKRIHRVGENTMPSISDDLKTFLDTHSIQYEIDSDLSKRTWIHRGGICKFFIEPISITELESLAHFLYKNDREFDVIGYSSNLWFCDNYSPEIILSTRRCHEIQFEGQYVVADAGVSMNKLTTFCVDNGIGGFEGFIDLPGTVGGAVCNNSGCYGSVTDEVLEKIEIISAEGKKCIEASALGFSHRNSLLKSKTINAVVLRAFFSTTWF